METETIENKKPISLQELKEREELIRHFPKLKKELVKKTLAVRDLIEKK